MCKIEVRPHDGYKAIFVDGELFDWGIEAASLKEARKFSAGNATLQKSIEGDIQRHLLESFSEFMDRPVTLAQLVEGIKTGLLILE